MKARTGAARLALLSGAPVVPIAQWGPQLILPYKARRPKLVPRTRISILAGAPVDLSAYQGKPVTAELLRDATTTIMRSVTALLAEIRGEQPPEVFYDAAHQAQQSVQQPEQTPVDAVQEGA